MSKLTRRISMITLVFVLAAGPDACHHVDMHQRYGSTVTSTS